MSAGTRIAPPPRAAACHGPPVLPAPAAGAVRVLLVGAPNVGKSALFNRLTGAYVDVSNYPGTSVEVAYGTGRIGALLLDVADTPGMYSLLPTTEEERVAQRMVLAGEWDVAVHVVDAKSIERLLPLTLQLAEVGKPLVVALNMMDEAERLGVRIDTRLLQHRLGVEVVEMVAVSGRGLDVLGGAIERARAGAAPPLPVYANGVGRAIQHVRSAVWAPYHVEPTVLAALFIQRDVEAIALVEAQETDGGARVRTHAEQLAAQLGDSIPYRVAYERRRAADLVLAGVVDAGAARRTPLADRLGRLLARPLTGLPVLALVLYFGLYRFVGVFGAGTLVDLIETQLFETRLTPFLERTLGALPWAWLSALLVGDYGILTLALSYAVAIILPIVGVFFLFFSVLEDSGYFPRLALLVDRGFKRIGLSGRAVIPMVLGFACDTMATMVTRTLETKRERVLATLLLALAIPCSAQLGVILAILAATPAALAVWGVSLLGIFLLVGLLAAKVIPGESASFHMELPPLRLPRAANVARKTLTRMHWYFREVLPLFVLASVLLWAMDMTGVFPLLTGALTPVVHALGLPDDAATVFLFGFFRRDYGAAGLFDLSGQGVLGIRQLTVAAVTLTLFVPCVAQFLMMLRERGLKTALGMVAFITPFAFGVGWLLNRILLGVGW